MLSLAKTAAALFALVALTRADIVITNFQVTGNGTSSITWSSSNPDTDPVSFTIELANPVFNTQFGLGNNIPTTNGMITFETPALIPGPNYSFRFVDNNNATNIIAQTNSFTIQEHDVASSTQRPLSGTTSIPLTSVSAPLSQSTAASTGAPPSGSSNPSITPAPSSTSPSSAAGSSSSASASVFNGGGSSGGNNGAGALRVSAMVGPAAAAIVAMVLV